MMAKLFKPRKTLGEILALQTPDFGQAAERSGGLQGLSAWLAPTQPSAPKPAKTGYQVQMEHISSPAELQRRLERSRYNDRKIKIALASLVCATLGQWLWPLNLLCIPCILFNSGHWYKKAYDLAKQGRVGVGTIFVFTVTGMILNGYFWIGSLVSLVAQLSIKLTSMVTDDSRNRLVDIYRQVPNTAWLLVDGIETETPLAQIRVGDKVVVNAGEIIPVDGTVLVGQALVDEQMLTGEAHPVEKALDEAVFAGTVLLAGRLEARVDKSGGDTAIARIGQILNNTIEYKSTAQLRAEILSDRTVAPTLLAGLVAFPLLGPMGALAVVDTHFRQRLSILSPLALMNYLNIASRHGILIKDGRSLDLLHQVDTLVFDKTGTLTDAQPRVTAVHAFVGGYCDADILRFAAAAEHKQSHPIALAILAEAARRGLGVPLVDESEYKIGFGLCVAVEGREVRVGSRRFMESSGISRPETLNSIEAHCHAKGHSLVLVACDGALAGAVELAPTVRPQAKAIIGEIKCRHGITATYIISGDQDAPTAKLAHELDIDHYFAETLPEEKAALIERLTNEGRFVCYIGDGINDAIALKKSHVSISLRGASTVATDTAQIVLMESDLDHLVKLFDYAHEFRTNTDISFAVVAGTTLIGISGAFFLHFGLAQTTMLSVGSIVIGVANSMRPLLHHRAGQDVRQS